MNVAIWHDHGSELQPYAELFELNAYRGEAGPGLHYREGELTAREKAGLLAVNRDKVRLRQNLKKILGLESLDNHPEIDVGAKQKKIQRVVDVDTRRSSGSGRGSRTARSCRCAGGCGDLEPSELSSRKRTGRISRSGGEEIDPELRYGGSIHFGELYFQQDLLGSYRPEGQDIDDILRISIGDHAGTLRSVLGRNVSRKYDRRPRGSNGD